MRRVAVTGLGAVTPLGHDARATWEAAVAGRSGVDFIRSFDAGGFPVRIASEVKDFDPVDVVGPKEARRLERNVVLAVAAAREAWKDGAADGVDPARAGILVGLGDRRGHGGARAARGPAAEGSRPRVAVVHPQRARRLRERADRDRPRPARAQLRARLGVRDRLARGGRGGGADPPRRRGRRPRRRHGGVHAPRDPRRVLRDARSRGRGGGSDARVATVRRDPRGIRHGRGCVRPAARGPRAGAGARRAGVRRGARLRDVERRAPHGAARPRVGRRRGDDARGAHPGRASSPSASGTSTRTGRRRRRATWRRRRRSRASSARTRTSSPCPRRSRCSGTSSGRPAPSRR